MRLIALLLFVSLIAFTPAVFAQGTSEFTATLPDRYRLPDRGFIWYLFTQSVREIQVMPDRMVIKYELQDEYKKPFKQFYH
jgi:hypothetical protein